MSEHLTTPDNMQEIKNNALEVIPVSPEELEEQRTQAENKRIETEVARTEAVGLALKEVHETLDSHDLESLIEDIDFSNVNKHSFSITANQGKMRDGLLKPGTTRGDGHLSDRVRHESYEGAWGDPYTESNSQHQVVEKAGIRQVDRYIGSTLRSEPRKGLLGKIGFKKQVGAPMRKSEEPGYVFDYSFNSPREGSEDAARAGHYNGQAVQLSIELTKGQATKLSSILAENPKAARQILDGFVRATGDYGAWNAELYDEEGNFYDPDERYNDQLLARDVRPNYEAIPDTEPQIVGLIGVNKEVTPKPEMYLPAA